MREGVSVGYASLGLQEAYPRLRSLKLAEAVDDSAGCQSCNLWCGLPLSIRV